MLSKHAIVAFVSIVLVTVQATPSAVVAAVGGSITSDCTGIRYQEGWLVADCLTGRNSTRMQSTVYLVSKVTNKGSLEWQTSGSYSQSCSDCKILDGAKLNCQCRPTVRGTKNTTLDLQEHIRNYNGHLLSDLTGSPNIPSTSSAVQIPANLRWDLFVGGIGCYSNDETYNKDNCAPAKNPDLSCPTNPKTYSSDGSPKACTSLRVPVGFPLWETFRSWSAKGSEKAWEFVVYDDVDCHGVELGKITPDKYGNCTVSEKVGKGVVVRPLWNADTT